MRMGHKNTKNGLQIKDISEIGERIKRVDLVSNTTAMGISTRGDGRTINELVKVPIGSTRGKTSYFVLYLILLIG